MKIKFKGHSDKLNTQNSAAHCDQGVLLSRTALCRGQPVTVLPFVFELEVSRQLVGARPFLSAFSSSGGGGTSVEQRAARRGVLERRRGRARSTTPKPEFL